MKPVAKHLLSSPKLTHAVSLVFFLFSFADPATHSRFLFSFFFLSQALLHTASIVIGIATGGSDDRWLQPCAGSPAMEVASVPTSVGLIAGISVNADLLCSRQICAVQIYYG